MTRYSLITNISTMERQVQLSLITSGWSPRFQPDSDSLAHGPASAYTASRPTQ